VHKRYSSHNPWLARWRGAKEPNRLQSTKTPVSDGASPRISWQRATRLWILSSATTVIVAGISWAVWQLLLHQRAHDPAYLATALIQTGPEVEPLPTNYLAELLDLSVDRPQNLYQVSLPDLKKRLLKSPCIANGEVKRVPANALQVVYTARQPIAHCIDLENSLLDREGVILPHQPFFRPQRLPKVYFGLKPKSIDRMGRAVWGTPVESRSSTRAMQILGDPLWKEAELLLVDLSRAFHPNLGLREIVLCCRLQRQSPELFVRIAPEEWKAALQCLESLMRQQTCMEGTQVIDLRMPSIAVLHPRRA
jgi:hypothetical protein